MILCFLFRDFSGAIIRDRQKEKDAAVSRIAELHAEAFLMFIDALTGTELTSDKYILHHCYSEDLRVFFPENGAHELQLRCLRDCVKVNFGMQGVFESDFDHLALLVNGTVLYSL